MSTGSPARASFQRVLATGAPDTMAVQKHSIPREESEGGGFEERYWSPINTPVLGPDGKLQFIHHRVEDVTEFVRHMQEGDDQAANTAALRTRAGEMEADVLRRARELQDLNAELRAANAKLVELERASEARHLLALTAARFGTFEFILATGELRWDRQMKRQWGLPPDEEFDYARAMERIHPEDRPRVDRAVQESLDPRSSGGYRVEYRLVWPDGSIHWIDARGQVEFEGAAAERRPVKMIGVEVDVTDRKRAEDALRASEERWNAAIENFSEGAIIATEDEQVIYWNPAARAMHGFTTEREGIGPLARTPDTFELWTPDGSHLLTLDEWPMRRIKRGEMVKRLELRLRRPAQGWERFVAYSGAMVSLGSGERLIFLSVSDLTEQRRAEREQHIAATALREQEERLRLAMESGRLGTWDVALDGLEHSGQRIRYSPYIGPMFGEAKGFEHASMAEWIQQIHPEDRERVLASFDAGVRGEAEYRAEFRALGSDGRLRWIVTRGAVIRDGDGRPVRALGVAMDITERKVSEERLREANERLLEADRRKDEFLAMLAHELRNPLAPIRNSSYILRHAPANGEQAHRAQEVIERQTQHLTRLVDDLLDVTRIVRGKIELRRERVDLRELVVRSTDDVRFDMDRNGVAFRVALPSVMLWADADPTRIAQVVGNLLHNASKFTRPGDEVFVSLAASGGFAEICVRDTGAGIHPDLLHRVFEPFVQADQSLARTQGGLGLGLALVKGVVELHGGTVRAESAGTGLGAQFIVQLPLAHVVSAKAEADLQAARSNGGRRVLVVDDNRDAAESLADLVRLLGHTAQVAYDGPSAIEQVQAQAPSVVLCDLGLPGMTGYEVAQVLRARGHDGLQLIAVSGYAQPEDVKRAIEAGFDGHVAKPWSPENIERFLA